MQVYFDLIKKYHGDISEETRLRSINPLPLTPIKNTLEV